MNNLIRIVDSLNEKLAKLLNNYNSLELENKKLINDKIVLEEKVAINHQLISDLENKHESLRIANAIVGSKEDKHLTKLKINALIREIDKCIVQLSD